MEDYLEKTYRSALKFLSPLNTNKTNALVVDEAVKIVKGDFGSILLVVGKELKRVYSSDKRLFKIVPVRKGYLGKVFKTKEPLLLTTEEIEKLNPTIKEVESSRNVLIVPLMSRKKVIGVLSVFSKVSSKFREEDLKGLKYFTSLASLAIKKTQLYEELKNAIETRDLFISMASHELKTPLTTISGYSQLLNHKLKGQTSTEARWVEELSWEVSRLIKLVQELLEMSRIRTGKLQYVWKEISLREIIKRALLDFRFNYPKRGLKFIDLVKNEHDTIVGDFDKLLQVIINLLDNAAKFSLKEKEIIITLKSTSDNLVINVQDFGQGVDKKDLGRIFEGFYKGENKQEGMGLGLFISARVVKEHKGGIKVDSVKGGGSNFEIVLPLFKK